MVRKPYEVEKSPNEKLSSLARTVLELAKQARRVRKSLSGDNYYGNKLAQMRVDATTAYREVDEQSAGDASALAELIEPIFSSNTDPKTRLEAVRELELSLPKLTIGTAAERHPPVGHEFFPSTVLAMTNRSYLISIGRQMNGCYHSGWQDACAVMARRILEIAIIEAFEKHGIANKIKDGNGDYHKLSKLIDCALVEPKFNLSKNSKRSLPKLRDAGHRSAHGRHYNAAPDDIEKMQRELREPLEAFLHLAGLQPGS